MSSQKLIPDLNACGSRAAGGHQAANTGAARRQGGAKRGFRAPSMRTRWNARGGVRRVLAGASRLRPRRHRLRHRARGAPDGGTAMVPNGQGQVRVRFATLNIWLAMQSAHTSVACTRFAARLSASTRSGSAFSRSTTPTAVLRFSLRALFKTLIRRLFRDCKSLKVG